jgi:hypothetical protein
MRRRFYSVLAVTLTVILAGAGAALAFFTTTTTATQLVTSSTLGAPIVASAVAAGPTSITVTVSTGPSAPAATGYVVYPHGTTTTPACTISGATGNCTVTGVTAGATTSYDVYSTLASWISSADTIVSALTPPAAPSGVTLVGGGTGGTYVDAANESSVEIDVTLPATSTTSDTVHLTISDGTTTITPTVKAGTSGAGTVAFTAINLSSLLDSHLTITAWSTNTAGSSTTVTASPVKDTVSPAPTLTTPANGSYTSTTTPTISGTAGTQIADAGHSADATSVTVTIYAGGTATGTALQTLPGTVTSGAWSVTPTALTGSAQYTAQVSQSDAAGNAGTATTTFVIDNAAPTVTVTAPTAASITTTLTPTFTGTAGSLSATTTHSADSSTVTVKVYSGTTATGTPVQTLTTTEASGAWSVAASSALTAGNQYTVQASQSDGVANTGTSTAVTFTAGPLPPVALKFVSLSGLPPVATSGKVEMIDINGNPVVNTTGAAISVSVAGGLLGPVNVTIAVGGTTSTQFTALLTLSDFVATATVNGQVLTGHT